MVGMTMRQSIQHMEQELEAMEPLDSKHTVLWIFMTNMLIKQSIKSFGVEKTMTSCKAEMKQIHMQNLFIPKHYYHELTPKQKSRMVESFCS